MSKHSEEQLQLLDAVAIVGLSGRFPGGRNVEQFWQDLLAGTEMISFFTDEELSASKIDPSQLHDPQYVKANGFLHGFEEFDAPFFKMTKVEAEIADPQQRLFLEIAWEALENAGYDPETVDGRIGVYGGAGKNNYSYRIEANPALKKRFGGLQVSIGNDPDMLATHVAYKLNLNGPSMTIQTACSTSLVAVHQACQSLILHETDMALAGGVSVRSLQKEGYLFQAGSILSPDGHCRPFDQAAKGTVPGDGAGMVVLKRYADALRDGDTVYAVIRGSSVNNDGSLKTGFTAPSVEGQAAVIADALALADVDPASIQYIETHGTATPLGDPIEMQALDLAYQTDGADVCKIGSVKSNTGHLDTAAGVTSLIKTALSLKHNQIPATLHFQAGNPEIPWEQSRFQVNDMRSAYDLSKGPARAAVSSFGIGGTNAHMILEAVPSTHSEPANRSGQLLVLSAKTETALRTAADNLANHLKQQPTLPLADIAYTLQAGRRAFAHRLSVAAVDHAQAAALLETLADSKRVQVGSADGERAPLVFLFPGQGAQYVQMGRELYATEPVFAQVIDRCAEQVKRETGTDLRTLFYPEPAAEEAARERLKQTQWTQPAIFVIEYALAKLLLSFGLRPSAMIGHSIGEFVAATLSGVIEPEDALSMIIERARLMQSLPAGKMLAIALSEAEVTPMLFGSLSLAAVNGPHAVVAAGREEEIAELNNRLQAQEVTTTLLSTSHAFHSEMMDPILPAFAERVGKIRFGTPQIPYLSNVTGAWITAELAADPQYYVNHLRRAVRFSDGISTLLADGSAPLFLEVGPGNVLSTLVRQQAKTQDRPVTGVFSVLRHRDDQISDPIFLLNTVGQLWVNGADIDWNAFHGSIPRRRVPLPAYPFERASYLLPLPELTSVQEEVKKNEPSEWHCLPTWQRTAPITALQQKAAEPGSTLLFADEHGVSEALARSLQAAGEATILVRAGGEFAEAGPDAYTLDPADPNGCRALLQELELHGKFPQRVVHAWSIDDNAGYEQAQDRGFHTLIRLVQALGERGHTEPLSILALTCGLQDVTGEAVQAPERATLYGALKVMAQENALLSTRAIDIRLQDAPRLASLLARELLAAEEQFLTAYRGTARFVQTFAPVQLAEGANAFRDGGVYLITGAAQQSGLVYAEYLASAYNAKLLLLDSAEQEPSGRAQELGRFFQVDLTDACDIRRAVQAVEAEWGPVQGVIHSVNVKGNGLIQLKTQEQLDAVLTATVKSTLALDAALSGTELDFFLLHNSTTAILGGFGQADNCAAAAFYDAFARAKQAQDVPALSINWSQWQTDTWQEEQMAGMPEVQLQLKELRETLGITAEEAMRALETLMHSGLPQAVVAPISFARVLEEQKTLTAASFLQTTDKGRANGSERADSANYAAPSNEVEAAVAAIWQELLGLDRIGVNEDFFGLGGNSLLAIQIIARLRKLFEVDVPMTAIFEAATIGGLAETVLELQLELAGQDELEALLKEIEGLSDDEITAKLGE